MPKGIFDELASIAPQHAFLVSETTDAWNIVPTDIRGQRIDHLIATNNDGIDHHVKVYLSFLGDTFPIGSALVPDGTGHAGAPGLDLIPLLVDPILDGIVLPPGFGLQVAVEEDVVADYKVYVIALGGTF